MKELIQTLESQGFVFTVYNLQQNVIEVTGCASPEEVIEVPEGVGVIGDDAFRHAPCVKHIIIPASVSIVRDGALTSTQDTIERVDYLGEKCAFRGSAFSMEALERFTIKNINKNLALQLGDYPLGKIVTNSLLKTDELTEEDQKLLAQIVLSNPFVQASLFTYNIGAMAWSFLLDSIGGDLTLGCINRLLSISVNSQMTAITAMLLEHKYSTFTQSEIDRFDEDERNVVLGFEAPTLSQMQDNFRCDTSNNTVEVSMYKGLESSIVVPRQLRDGTLVTRVADIFYLRKPIKDIVVDGVGEIGQGCFSGGKTLERLCIRDGTYWIDKEVFLDCEILSEITLPKTLKMMYLSSFFDTKLDTITIPCALTMITSQGLLESLTAVAYFKPSEEESTVIQFHRKGRTISYWRMDSQGNKTKIKFHHTRTKGKLLQKVR